MCRTDGKSPNRGRRRGEIFGDTFFAANGEMLDIIQFLEDKGGNPEQIRKSQKARGDSVEIVDQVINEYKEWTRSKYTIHSKVRYRITNPQ